MLEFIFEFLILSIIILFFIPSEKYSILKLYALVITSFVLLFSCYLCLNFDFNEPYFQYLYFFDLDWYLFNLSFLFGLDGLGLLLLLLTSFLIFLCVLFCLEEKLLKYYLINLLFIELLLLLVFSVLDVLLFYIFFEAILIPMYLIIGIWGSRARKIRAAYLLFFYTLVGSLAMLAGIIYIYLVTGTLSLEYLFWYKFTFEEQFWLWLAFFLSFASKIPVFPFHIWLPEAHVEAPTVGSVLLAGVLLKLGVFGFLRYSLTLFPEASIYFSPIVYILGSFGVVYTSFTAIRQMDLKRVIAYSSVAHMNLIVVALFSFNLISFLGSVVQSLSHGFVASALFFLIGIIYSRYHTRLLYYYSGLGIVMPLYATFFLIFTMSNIALPGTSSFVGEFLLFLGISQSNFITLFICLTSVIVCGSYSLWLFNRVIFGNLKTFYLLGYNDLTLKEFFILLPLCFFVFLLGIYPTFCIKFISQGLSYLIVSNFLL